MSLHIYIGGISSGKTARAMQDARNLHNAQGKPIYVAAGALEAKDDETAKKIFEHQRERGNDWETISPRWQLGDAITALIKNPNLQSNLQPNPNPQPNPRSVQEQHAVVIDSIGSWLSAVLIDNANEQNALIQSGINAMISCVDAPNITAHVVVDDVSRSMVAMTSIGRAFERACGETTQQLVAVANEVFVVQFGIAVPISQWRRK
ncbi:MAG: bifunctional adenosylcobinamide kinase/adenosylcobinamide-phosphate guanylyltransferase [Alphaproteobacteria bacterium]|nr:bifunctional adenosylcobinamide kinase/adenosylcobinamide-phosphate guanylyltransferase [Alphaproteobacteria bacterium]